MSLIFFFNCSDCLGFLHSIICVCVSEHQELVQQIDDITHQKQKQDLQRDLERLVARMEEKGVQITKLRKHQQTVSEPQPISTSQRFDGKREQSVVQLFVS